MIYILLNFGNKAIIITFIYIAKLVLIKKELILNLKKLIA